MIINFINLNLADKTKLIKASWCEQYTFNHWRRVYSSCNFVKSCRTIPHENGNRPHHERELVVPDMSWDNIELAIAEHRQGRNISPQSHIINDKAKLITTSWCEQYASTTDEEHTHHAILFKKLSNNLAWNWKQTTLKKRELRGVFQICHDLCAWHHIIG